MTEKKAFSNSFSLTDEIADIIRERILKGDISIQPYELGDEDACRLCRYHSVCGFDRKVEGCEKRRLRPLDKTEIWRRLEEEEA